MSKNNLEKRVINYRSKSDGMIGTTFSERGIKARYEPTVYVRDSKGRGKFRRPDFYIDALDLFVEYAGRNDSGYLEEIRKKKEEYARIGMKVLWLYREDVWVQNNGIYRVRADFTRHLLKKIEEAAGA